VTSPCPDCRERVSHCHGTLIVFDVDTVECTDPKCVDLDGARHGLVIEAGQVDAATAARSTAA